MSWTKKKRKGKSLYELSPVGERRGRYGEKKKGKERNTLFSRRSPKRIEKGQLHTGEGRGRGFKFLGKRKTDTPMCESSRRRKKGKLGRCSF